MAWEATGEFIRRFLIHVLPHGLHRIRHYGLLVRARAESFADIAPGEFQQVLITEYSPGAAIGWHKDRSVFGDVVGISLLASCIFRLRLKAGPRWERRKLIAEPRSVYLLRGLARTDWEHSIPGVESLRYSITFRNVLEGAARP
jgi:alkylated DNA repair dioxygenase AlkB